MNKRSTLIEIITVLNIILFLYTGIAKIIDYSIFKEQLAVSPILGPVANLVALLLSPVEFFVVVMLIIPRWRMKGLYSTLLLMILFTGYIVALYTFSKEMPCSCGGIIDLLSWRQHIVFNCLFIMFNIWAIKLLSKEKKELAKVWNDPQRYSVSHG